MEIYRQYGPAKTRHDREFFERVESEDYVLFVGNRTMTREQNIAWMESWSTGIVYDEQVQTIKVLGFTAVVTGVSHEHHPTGEVQSFRFIDVCVRKDGEWKILSSASID